MATIFKNVFVLYFEWPTTFYVETIEKVWNRSRQDRTPCSKYQTNLLFIHRVTF